MNLENKKYTRKELEEAVRHQYPSLDSLGRYAVASLNLDPKLFSITPYIILLHWVLDMLTVIGKKTGAPNIDSKVTMGLAPPRRGEKVKILGFVDSNDEVFSRNFMMKLASLINTNNAIAPGEYEGIDVSALARLMSGAEPIVEELAEKKTKKNTKEVDELLKTVSSLVERVTALEAKVEAHHELLSNM